MEMEYISDIEQFVNDGCVINMHIILDYDQTLMDEKIQRPYLKLFLDVLYSTSKGLILWSAVTRSVAEERAKLLESRFGIKFDHVMSRDDMVTLSNGALMKRFSDVPVPSLSVDDLPINFSDDIDRRYVIEPFYGQFDDIELLRILSAMMYNHGQCPIHDRYGVCELDI